jgi:type I restriction enzyme S subunit
VTLPAGWASTKLGEVALRRSGNSKLIKGKLFSSPSEGTYPAFSASGQDVWHDSFDHEGEAIILSAVGARCGKAFKASGKWSAIANTHVIRPVPEVADLDFVFLLLNDENFWEKGGTAQPFVKVSATFERLVNLPPLTEQRRIVAKLDALTAGIARARAELERVILLVSNERRALLEAAFSGALAAEFAGAIDNDTRAIRSDKIDGRVGVLPQLPNGWKWMSLGEVSDVSGGLTKNAKRTSLPLTRNYLRVANVYADELRLDDVAEIGCTETEYRKTRLEKGDLLIVEGNGSLDQVGRVALWNGEIPDCSHQNHLIRVRPQPLAIPRFVLLWLLSPGGREHLERLASSSSGLHTLSISKVAGLPLPFPPIEVQLRVVEQLDGALRKLSRTVAEAARSKILLGRLEAAILAKAFRGELVPQDPADEPAEKLLERIRAQSAAAGQNPARGRRKSAA